MSAKATLLWCGPFSAVLYVSAVVTGGAIRPGFSHVADAVSELTAAGAPNKALMDALFLAYNLLVAAFAAGLLTAAWPDPRARRAGRAGAFLLGGTALCGVLLQLFFPQDPGGPPVTVTGTLHVAIAGVAALTTLSGIACLAAWFWREPELRSLAWFSVATLAVMLVSGGAGAAAAASHHPLMGLVERITLGAITVWLFTTGARLIRLHVLSSNGPANVAVGATGTG